MKFSFLPYSPLTQNLDKNQNLDKQINSFHIQITFCWIPPKNAPKKIPPKKILPKKILPKKSSQNVSPKQFHQKNSVKEVLQKILQKNYQKKFPKSSKKFQKNITNIALGGSNPFGACFVWSLIFRIMLAIFGHKVKCIENNSKHNHNPMSGRFQ